MTEILITPRGIRSGDWLAGALGPIFWILVISKSNMETGLFAGTVLLVPAFLPGLICWALSRVRTELTIGLKEIAVIRRLAPFRRVTRLPCADIEEVTIQRESPGLWSKTGLSLHIVTDLRHVRIAYPSALEGLKWLKDAIDSVL